MEAPEIDSRCARSGGSSFQYSLRTMFLATTVFALGLSGVFAGPVWLSVLTFLLFAVATPVVLTVVLVYGRGYARTFCIGALFPAGALLLGVVPGGYPFFIFDTREFFRPHGTEASLYVRIVLLISCVAIIASGLLAMGTRWMVEAPQRQQQRKASPRAEPVIDFQNVPSNSESGPYWCCASCGKTVPASLDLCWNCSAARTPRTEASDPANDDARL